MELVLDRWLHILAGITWIGLLYYFNFVQVPGLGQAKADGTAAGITKHIAPRALLWFRWAAAATWITGAYYLIRFPGHSFMDAFTLQGGSAYIGIGAWLGTIMLFNVWVLIEIVTETGADAGVIDAPLSATALPRSNVSSMHVVSSGAVSGDTVRDHMLSSGSIHGSSSTPPSYETCNRVASME